MRQELARVFQFVILLAIAADWNVSSFTLKMGTCRYYSDIRLAVFNKLGTFLFKLTALLWTTHPSTGLLKVGVPKTWDDSKKNLHYIRKAGIRQFISTYNRVKDLKGDELLWGDEIEYGVFILDPDNKKIRLSLRAKEVSLEMPFCGMLRTIHCG